MVAAFQVMFKISHKRNRSQDSDRWTLAHEKCNLASQKAPPRFRNAPQTNAFGRDKASFEVLRPNSRIHLSWSPSVPCYGNQSRFSMCQWLTGAFYAGLLDGMGWVAGGCWDIMIDSSPVDHSRKFPTFSTSKMENCKGVYPLVN